MSLDEYRGVVWAFSELMKRARADIARGDAKAARAPCQRVDARKTHLGQFAAKALRRAVGWRGGGKS